MIIIGIDPGLSGGLAALVDGLPMLLPMPVADGEIDGNAVRLWLDERRWAGGKAMVFLEKVHSMPKQGVASTFTFAAGWGLIRGILTGLCIPYQLVTPQAWQKELLAGLDRTDTKAAAYLFASRLWPTVDWRASDRCRKPHSGIVDAACIAEYGRRKEGGAA
jgi:crossover junction endodeoxyribonuclease RuvC